MHIAEALELLQKEEPIVVRDTTFEPRGVDEVILDTGETVYWTRAKDGTWLSIDPEGEEIILFEDLDEVLEPEDEIVVYGGSDYEFSYEGKVTILQEDGGMMMTFKEFEGPSSAIIRIMEDEGTGTVTCTYGKKLTEEELQKA